jgi:uncharacterized protein (TIGR03435 family)
MSEIGCILAPSWCQYTGIRATCRSKGKIMISRKALAGGIGPVVAVSLLTAGQMIAQSASQPSFLAASVKIDSTTPAHPSRRGGPGSDDPGRLTYTQLSLMTLILFSYDVKNDQVYAPTSVADLPDLFTITATMPLDTTREQLQFMLQDLLAERFHLRLHHETRDRPGFDLVVAAGGSKLKKWVPDPAADTSPTVSGGSDAQGFPRLAPGKLGRPVLFPRGGKRGMVQSTDRTTITDFAADLGMLINLSNGARLSDPQPVVADKTALAGIYEFRLEFEGGSSLAATSPSSAPDAVPVAGDPSDGLTLFVALEKQLGLKLMKAKSVPVDVLVIDHMDKVPTEN